MRLNVREQGSGSGILLLHGLFGAARNLSTLQTALATHHRVAAMDLRNHGASPHAEGMAYPDLAADVIQTLAAIDMPTCAVIGHSMGGKVAMRIALDAPGIVTRLLVADIAPIAYEGEFARFAAAMRSLPLHSPLSRAEADVALAAAVPDPGVRAFLLMNLLPGPIPSWRIGLEEISRALPDVLTWPATTRSFDGPTLFVGGDRSDYIRPDAWATIHTLFPAATSATITNAGHWLHVDNPAGFRAVAEAFLSEV